MSGQPTGERPSLGEDEAKVPGQGPGQGQPGQPGQPGATDEQAREQQTAAIAAITAATGARDVPGTSPGVVGGAAAVAESERAVAAQAGVEQTVEQRSGRIHQIEPDEHSPLNALTSVISADFRRALLATLLACAALGLSYAAGGVLTNTPAKVGFFSRHSAIGHAAAIGGAVLFLIFGVVAVRSATGEILKTVPSSLGDNRKAGLRWVCLLVGYLIVIFGTLGALNVPIERLLLGGAVTGVILGIAAQQSLGNVFAGLMLLLTRPFAIGDEISIRSGSLGGVLTGLVADMNLTYVKLVTDNGTVLLPNAAILSAVIGPPGVFG
ncbi:mechanosensitive ion channel family protein [Actinocrinis puniceicyclus]|uniref:Mechanosensitive ion channel family protein n=1 Tax=Actinocrinis puniceicyclus TaxID=977794 RepID=A0A8J8BDR0_9ACTN|nr:mechanosensitive ion channel family protein [Actinocrinis puniceicyclus]MBS2966502.1 mechanosensitive ion channel family protein [Actinocrinis puniceicyclus]